MPALRSLAFPAVCLVALSLCAQTPSRITAKVDDAARVTLGGTVHPLARAANDRGALPDGTPLKRLQIVLKKSGAQEQALRQLVDDLHNPSSPSFHQWLTPESFGKQFGPSDADVAALSTWLASKGFTVTGLKPGRQTLEFEGTAGQFREAFHSEIHNYSIAGTTRHANNAEPQIPAALAPVFGGFASLNNFEPRAPSHIRGKVTYDPATGKSEPSWTTGSSSNLSFPLAPGDFAVQYDTAPLLAAGNNGSGQTIAVISISNVEAYLVAQYRKLFNLPVSPLQVIVDGADPGLDGINNTDGINGFLTEVYLDVEMTGMAAPGANIDLVIAGDTVLSDGFLLASEHAVYNNLAPIMSLSVEECEAGLGTGGNAAYNALWQQAAAQGITVVVSSSDSGSAGCDNFDTQKYATDGQQVNGFASTPYNLAVGGTDFYYSNYAAGGTALSAQIASYWNETVNNATPTTTIKGYIPEQPWNDSQYGLNAVNYYTTYGTTNIIAGSGGPSNCAAGSGTSCTPYAKPAWQAGTGVPADRARDLPDVSLFAANDENYSYYPICDSDGQCQPVGTGGTVQFSAAGGTSASAPAFAGVMALVTQKYGRQGQANYTLYPLAAQYPASFHDVAIGTITVPCNIATTPSGEKPVNCIAVANPITVPDQNYGTGSVVEGEVGSGSTAFYNAGTGYDLATGLGSVDVNVMIANWGKVAFAGSTTTLTPSATSFAHGTAVTVAGKVTGSGTPTGQVALMTTSPTANSQGLTDYVLASGSYSGALATLPGGTYSIYGRYGGDTLNGASASTPVNITVTPENSGTALKFGYGYTLYSSGLTVSYGAPLGLEAISAPTAQLTTYVNCLTAGGTCPVFTAPTGSVSFTESGHAFPSVPLNANGEGFYAYAAVAGSHTVSATYSGDASYGPSSSAAATFTVNKNTPTLSAAKNTYGNGFRDDGGVKTFTFEVQNSNASSASAMPPSGSLTFSGGPTGMPASATLTPSIDPSSGAVASVATVALPASTPTGTFTVTYTYPGDTNYSSTSANFSLVLKAPENTYPTTITATVSSPNSTPGAAATITATVTGSAASGTPTGYITLFSDGLYYSFVTLPAATGTSVTTTFSAANGLFAGGNVITVEYLPTGSIYQASETTVSVNETAADFTLQPLLSTLSVPGAQTDVLSLASNRGFAGPVSLSCVVVGLSCSLSPSSVTLASGGSGTAMLTITPPSVVTAGSYTVVVTGVDATGQYVHTAAVPILVANDNVWTVNANSTLDKLTSAGAVTSLSGSANAVGSFGGIAFDSGGNAWAVSSGNNALLMTSSAGGTVTAFTGGGLSTPVSVAVDGAGSLWIANSGNNSVSDFTNAGGVVSGTAGFGTSDGLSGPSSVSIDATGGVWVTNKSGNSVTHIFGAATPVTTPTTSAVSNATLGVRP